MIELRNPHSILAAMQVRPRGVKSLRLPPVTHGDIWEQVAAAAHDLKIPVTGSQRDRSGSRSGRDTERAGGGSAVVEPPSPVPLDILFSAADESSRSSIWLALDQIQDPQNMGAIFRLAAFFGVCGIVMTKDRSAPVNATVCDVAAGGVEYVAYSVVPNLAQAIEKSQQNGIWVLGTCERATNRIQEITADRHWMLVVGNEGQGLRRLTREKCDQLVSFPALGAVPSLNVATATAACLALLTNSKTDHGRK